MMVASDASDGVGSHVGSVLGGFLELFFFMFFSFFSHFSPFFFFLSSSFFFSSATLVAQTTSIYSWKTPFILFLSLGILPSLTQGVFVFFFFCFTSLFIGKNEGSRTLLGGMIMVISLFRLEHVYFCISKAFLKKIELNFFSLL